MPFICLTSLLLKICGYAVRLIVIVGFFLGICLNKNNAQSVQRDSFVIPTDSLPRIELSKNTVLKQRTIFDYWIDPTQSYTMDSVLRHKDLPFQRTQGDILSLDFKHATIWCRFVVRYYEPQEESEASEFKGDSLHRAVQKISASQQLGATAPFGTYNEPFILLTMNRQADTAIFVCVNPATGRVCYSDTNGYSVPYNRWSVKTVLLAFMIPDDEHPAFAHSPQASTRKNAKNHKDMVCYVQFRTHSFSVISFRAVEYDSFFSNNTSVQISSALFLGFFLFAACYNLILFIVTRSRFYLFYVGSVLCFALYSAIDFGSAYPFLQTGSGINTHLLYGSGLLYNALSALFVRAFWMERREFVPRALNYALLAYVSLNIVAILFELFGAGYVAFFALNYLFMFMGAPLMLAGTFLIWRKGYAPARYLFTARCFSEIGFVLNFLLLGNLIQTDIPLWVGYIATLIQVIAPILELLLFSFALAARFTVLQQEKQAAEREALQGEAYRRENELLYNANLEITRQQNEIVQLNHSLQDQNEKLAETNREKDELMGIVVHDLKNPIGAVRGYAELIENQILTGNEVLSASGQIVLVSDRMLELVKNLLDMNHMESGGLQLNMVSFDIVPVIEAVVYQYHAPAQAKQLSLHFSNNADENIVSADEQALMQVLDNIISNAVKYSPYDKQVFVRVLKNESAVRVEVQDEGEGISVDDMKKVFGKFARLSAQPTGGEHSTGLGLSIVKKMVEAMNGRVWCESEFGKGATFIVELPASH